MSGTVTGSPVHDEIAGEFLRSRRGGARLVAVASPDAALSAAFAEDLAAAFARRGVLASSAAQDGRSEEALRDELVAPLRAAGADAVTIVAGDGSLLAGRARWLWHFRIWLATDDDLADTTADAIVDITDPQHPARRLADFCQCDVG
ncbi:hypothetical protein DY023_07845 [Microbacterium bovistercoris]|uniref:Uncharacterized protein n=1 Tax=Microbacterium bovistercoris TaxID=2293570 RepID=A0A371NUA5_9MICO|nr:hypothetical protein [Microbacterium bovistercoris]REJ05855.1 hypothetical protein DY023_07845 [Microbacterium bovistercoris]